MIYLDSSVALAYLLAEGRGPQPALWDEALASSRLLQYEVWNRIHARNLQRTHGNAARALIGRISMIELVPSVLARALEPFPGAVRTLDGLHLASCEFLRSQRDNVRLASYDERMLAAARAMHMPLYRL